MPVRNYSFSAGETKHLGAGNRLRLLDSTAQVTVKFFRDGSEISTETAEGVEAGYQGEPPREDGKSAFDDVTVYSATAQTVKILTTRGDSRYDRTVGDVQSEPKLTQSASGPVGYDALAYNGFAFSTPIPVGAVAGQYSHAQLRNPAASGKTIYVDRLFIGSTVATTVDVALYNTALASAAAGSNAKKHHSTGLASIATLLYETNAAKLYASTDIAIQVPVLASGFAEIEFPIPYILREGEALVVAAGAVNTSIYPTFEWREYA